jgi:hypothetical protein
MHDSAMTALVLSNAETTDHGFMKLSLAAAGISTFAAVLFSCAKPDAVSNRASSISIPEGRFSSQPFDGEAFVAGITIQPPGAVLTSRELLYLSSFFQQTIALSQADGKRGLTLSKDNDVYKSLDASLRHVPEWREATGGEKVDVAAVVNVIEKTQR